MTHKRKRPNRKDEKPCEITKALPLACADETAAVELLEKLRWGETPCCPRCGSTSVKKMMGRDGTRNARFLWRCYDCKKAGKHEQFTVRIGTVYEETKLPLRVWCYAIWRACTSKKGVAALEIHRQCGISYKSALYLMHRVRHAMATDWTGPGKLSGTVEVDETFVGGKPRNPRRGGQGKTDKQPVMVMVERNGNARFSVLPAVTAKNLDAELRTHVSDDARLMTDEAIAYRKIGQRFAGGHFSTCHSKREYARGDVYSNTAESVFSLLKRGFYGIWHATSRRHLHRYLASAEFRYNHGKATDGQRVAALVLAANGKRLLYREPVSD